ncbi:MAG: aminotransferase class V-fold PLP-dependent enzyme [Thermoguttaceae bacterium]
MQHHHSASSPYAAEWALDPQVAMLNHGSFGACPRAVLQRQQQLRQQMEAEPVRFFLRELPPLLDESRRTLAELLGAEWADLVFVRNVTEAVNSVLRSLSFEPADELLVTNHAYNACRNVVHYVAQRSGATVVTAQVPLEVGSPDEIVEAVLRCVTPRTRLAMLDHVTSPTAMIFPIQRLVAELDRRGVDTLVDGAHAPGMVPVDLQQINAAYYGANLHKWLCSPKGAGFLHVRADKQAGLQPVVISHGFNMPRSGRPPLHVAFDWPGTVHPTPWLCVGDSIRFLQKLTGEGLDGLMRQNHALAVQARQVLCDALGLAPPCPDAMLGSMAAVRLPDESKSEPVMPLIEVHPLQTRLLEAFGIEVPVFYWPAAPQLLVRVSAQAYNSLAQYERLADALRKCRG